MLSGRKDEGYWDARENAREDAAEDKTEVETEDARQTREKIELVVQRWAFRCEESSNATYNARRDARDDARRDASDDARRCEDDARRDARDDSRRDTREIESWASGKPL